MDYNVHRRLCKARGGAGGAGRGESWSGRRTELAPTTAGNEDQILERQKAIQSGDRLNRILRQVTSLLLHGRSREAIVEEGNNYTTTSFTIIALAYKYAAFDQLM